MHSALSEKEMNALLKTETFGHLACSDEGKPYIVPMAYVFHDDVLYGQTTEGKKVDALRKNPSVCFQVQQQKGKEWRSVMCHGEFEELDFSGLQTPEMIAIVKKLTERIAGIQGTVGVSVPYSFEGNPAPLSINGKASTLFRIVVKEKSGRLFVRE